MMGATQTVSLEDEAGICAYYNVGSDINLTKARGAYTSIDMETDAYIIGIVAEGCFEEIYPRVYTRKDGWIMAYQPRGYSEGGIFQHGSAPGCDAACTTLWYSIRNHICPCAGFGYIPDDPEDLVYYNFQQPDAEEMLVVSECIYIGTNIIFNYTIQSGVTIYSGSHSLESLRFAELYVDDDRIDVVSSSHPIAYGYLNSTHLKKDVPHNVKLNSTTWCRESVILFYKI